MPPDRRDLDYNPNEGTVGDGDPSGIVTLSPWDPDYPTPEQLARLKGAPGPQDVRPLTPEEVQRYQDEGLLMDDDELVEARRPKAGGLKLLG